MNEKGNIGSYLLGILFVTVIVIGLTSFMAETPKNYGVNESTLDNTSFVNKVESINEMSENMKDTIENSEITGIGVVDAPILILKGGYQAVMLSLDSMDLFIAIISDLATSTGIMPSWFVAILISAASLVIVLIVISSLLRYELIRW